MKDPTETMADLEAELLGRPVRMIDVRGLSTRDGRIWMIVYDASSDRQEQRRVALYRQLDDEYTALFSGILHVATKGKTVDDLEKDAKEGGES